MPGVRYDSVTGKRAMTASAFFRFAVPGFQWQGHKHWALQILHRNRQIKCFPCWQYVEM